jgi:hypothetical protein
VAASEVAGGEEIMAPTPVAVEKTRARSSIRHMDLPFLLALLILLAWLVASDNASPRSGE